MVYVNFAGWEGWDMPMEEAYAQGIPSITFDVGAHKEHLKYGIMIPHHKNKKKRVDDFGKCMELMMIIHNAVNHLPKGCIFIRK